MKKFFVFTLLFAAFIAITSNAAVSSDNNDVVGEWKYEVPNAPYGYQQGVISFTEENNELSGEVKFSDGYKVKLKEVSYEEGKLTLGLYIDYEYITVKADVEEGAMKGNVNTSEGKMNFTAEKIK
jgi:hypothetical protein